MTSFAVSTIYKAYPEIIQKFLHIFIVYGGGPLRAFGGVRNGGMGKLVKGDAAGNEERMKMKL
jgi:hypothetical protein